MASSALFSTTAAKVFASVVLVGGAASVAGLGTFGSFTSTTNASESVSSGKVELTLGSPALGLSVAAVNLLPGDSVQRAITLNRSADSEKFGSVTMTTASTVSPATVLTTDATNGLQLKVEQCATSWAQSGNVLTCAQTPTLLMSSRQVIGTDVGLGQALTDTLNSGIPTAFLKVTVTLPTTADNAFQSKSDGVKFAFTATQRTTPENH